MDHYLDIRLLPDPEFPASLLMNALFGKLHRVLVQLNSSTIGVSFPEVDPKRLGRCLRLHGSNECLDRLMQQTWLKGMRDHTEVGVITRVPESTTYCQVKRVQSKSSAERLRRRYLTRHPETTAEELDKLIPDSVETKLNLPYLRLKSVSSGQDFLLFLRHKPETEARSGEFNTYGLSNSATLPWF